MNNNKIVFILMIIIIILLYLLIQNFGHFESRLYYNTQQYRVVFYLKDNTILSGNGSSSTPYTVEEDWAWFDSYQVL